MHTRILARSGPIWALALALSLGACSEPAPVQPPPDRPGPVGPGPTPTPPRSPQGLSASASPEGVLLRWTADSGATGHRILRAERAEGPHSVVATLGAGASDYLDAGAPAGQVAHYQVVAVNAQGASAPASVSATRPAPTRYGYAAIAPQSDAVAEAQGRALGGKLYVFGGFDSRKRCCTPTDRAAVYDPASNSWAALPNLPERGGSHMGMASDGTDLYFAGGYVANAAWTGQIFGTRKVWRYNVAARTYTALPDLPEDLAAGQLVALDGRLYHIGGTNPARTQDLGAVYMLDLRAGAGAWVPRAALPRPRQHAGSAALGGLIYLIGGQTGHDEGLVTRAAVDVYDPATDTWRAGRDLPRARSHIGNSTFVQGGRIVVAGGETAHNAAMPDVTAYDPATGTWTELTPLPAPRVSGVAAALGETFVYTGGSAGSVQAGGWQATPSR